MINSISSVGRSFKSADDGIANELESVLLVLPLDWLQRSRDSIHTSCHVTQHARSVRKTDRTHARMSRVTLCHALFIRFEWLLNEPIIYYEFVVITFFQQNWSLFENQSWLGDIVQIRKRGIRLWTLADPGVWKWGAIWRVQSASLLWVSGGFALSGVQGQSSWLGGQAERIYIINGWVL